MGFHDHVELRGNRAGSGEEQTGPQTLVTTLLVQTSTEKLTNLVQSLASHIWHASVPYVVLDKIRSQRMGGQPRLSLAT